MADGLITDIDADTQTAARALRHDLHRAPELSGQESATAQAIANAMTEAGAVQVVSGLGGTGVAAVFGAGERNLLIRCELDALPIVETGRPAWVSKTPGVAHLCGHDGHMAILFAVARRLGGRALPCRVTLLFQPAEETGAGARAVLDDPRFDELRPDMAISLHNLPGLPLGAVALKAGPVNCASRGLKIRLNGRTSHASEPEKSVSPAGALAALIPALSALGAALPVEDPEFRLVTITHARLGEPTFGVTPGEAELRVTLRTLLDDRMAALETQARAVVADLAGEFAPDITVHEAFAHCVNDPTATDLLDRATAHLPRVEAGLPMRASEDFGLFGGRVPAAMLFLGSGEDCPPLHAPDYDFPDDLIGIGAGVFLRAINGFSGRNT